MSYSFVNDIDGLKIMLHKSSSYTMPAMHYHNYYEIGILEVGECSYMHEDQLLRLRPRDVRIVNRNKIHCSVGGAQTGTLLEFSESYLQRLYSEQSIPRIVKCFEKNVIRVRERDFPELISLVEKLHDSPDDIFAFTRLFAILENNMSRKTYDIQNTDSKISDIIDYISENYKSIDSLDSIANEFYISKQHLCRLFKTHTDTSIVKYINDLKIHTSLGLITKKNITMTEVAEQSGFSSLANFSQTFKSVTGISPLKYRNSEFSKKSKP